MKTRKTLTAAAVALSLSLGTVTAVNATLMDFQDGNGAIDIGNLDWGPANILTVGSTTAILEVIDDGDNGTNDVDKGTIGPVTGYVVGTDQPEYHFEVLVHASLFATADSGGTINTPTGISDGDFELTLVMGFVETVEQVFTNTDGSSAVDFATVDTTPNYVEIYYDDGTGGTTPGDNLTGAGFNDGTLIFSSVLDLDTAVTGGFSTDAKATPDGAPNIEDLDQFTSANGNNYPNVLTVTGSGNNGTFTVVTTEPPAFIDDLYFLDDILLELSLLDVNQNVPFLGLDPSRCFVQDGGVATSECEDIHNGSFQDEGDTNAVIPTVGSVNGLAEVNGGGPDFIFTSDFNSRLIGESVVPEPASLALMGIGLLGVGGMGMRRRKQRKA